MAKEYYHSERMPASNSTPLKVLQAKETGFNMTGQVTLMDDMAVDRKTLQKTCYSMIYELGRTTDNLEWLRK